MSVYEVPNLIEQFQASLIRERVGIIEFAESPKYLGRRLYPRQKTLLKIIFLEDLDDYDKAVIKEWQVGREGGGEVDIVPKLEKRIQFLKANNYQHFRVIQLVGGRRSSKGFLSAIIIAYKAYLLTLYDDMHRELNLPAGKEIFFPIVADSLDQAKAHQFADASDAIMDCKQLQLQKLIGRVLQETVTVHTPSDIRRAAALRSQGVKIDRDMASIQIKAHGTNSKTIRGSASLMFIFDEMAHLIPGESRMSDDMLWVAAIPSLAQFREQAMILANSSPYQKTGKFYEISELAYQLDPPEDGDPVFPDYFSMRFPSWELYKDWDKFNMTPPQIDDPVRDPILASEERADPDSFKVEYRAEWAEVMNAFLRPEMVDRAFDPAHQEAVLGKRLSPTHGAIFSLRYKGHGDPAAVGPANFGIAVGHVEEVENENGVIEQHVVFDMIDAFYPDDFPDNTIDWLEVVPEITNLINLFRPFEWTFDQFDCLDKDTLLPTTKGLLSIEEIVGDLPIGRMKPLDQSVQSMADVRPITSAYRRGPSDTLTFATKLGSTITTTLEHRLWVRPRREKPWQTHLPARWVQAAEIRLGDSLFVRVGNMMPQDKVVLPTLTPSRYHPHDGPRYSPTVCSREMASVLGLLIGEAHVSNKAVQLTNTNRDVVNFVEQTANSLWGGGWKVRQTIKDHPRWADSWTIGAGPTLARFLQLLGVRGSSSNREVPEIIRRSPEEVVAWFMRGLFEGEGGVTVARENDEVVRLDTTSKRLAEQTQQLLFNLGIVSTLAGPYRDKRKESYHLKYRVKIFGPDIVIFAEKIGFISTKKREQLGQAVAQVVSRGEKAGLRRRVDREDHGVWVRIVNIEETTGDTYDISVPGPESFVANGVISHNSRMAIQQLVKNLQGMGIDIPVYEKPGTQKLNERRWKNFRAALNLGRIHAPHPETFNPIATRNSIELARNELKFLVEKAGRVDHQTVGPVKTKDIADCMAEVVDALIGDTINPQIGSLNALPALGYGLGGGIAKQGNTDSFAELSDWYRDTGSPRGLKHVPHDPARGRKGKRHY